MTKSEKPQSDDWDRMTGRSLQEMADSYAKRITELERDLREHKEALEWQEKKTEELEAAILKAGNDLIKAHNTADPVDADISPMADVAEFLHGLIPNAEGKFHIPTLDDLIRDPAKYRDPKTYE